MAKQTGRSLQLSAQGRQKADIALQKFAGKRDLAANLGMSPTTVTNFFAGRPVKRREFHEICKKLKLNWQEVADLPRITESESSKPSQKLQDNSSDIDALVQEMRSLCCDKVQHLYSKIQLLNRQQIDIDQLDADFSPEKVKIFALNLSAVLSEMPDLGAELANKLLLFLKKKVDGLIASEDKLQKFLDWGNRKSCSVQVPYKLAAVRAFYLNLPSATVLDLGSSPDFELECNLINSLEPTLGSRFSPYASSFYEHALDLDFRLMFGLGLFLEGTRTPEYVLDICISSLAHNRDYSFYLVTEMEQFLQSLRNQLPDFKTKRSGFWEWRATEGQAWAEKLRDVLIKYRNIGHDWQFTIPQKELLQQYYDTNKLLVDCLNSACSVSDGVKAEIEETLLLPITEIEKRQPQM